MSRKNREIVKKEKSIQAILVADTFEDEFVPLSDDIPLCLFPVVNKPLIDYTLEFLSLGGVEETFLFCCQHVAEVKAYISKCISEAVGWTLTMKVHIIASESCLSFGDCLRDLDAKGLLTGDFVLCEPGVISNINFVPLLKNHLDICSSDRGAAMTLIFQEAGLGHVSRCPNDETLIAVNSKSRILFHKKVGMNKEKKIDFPLEIFLDNPSASIHHNLKDTHIAICSSAVLPLFSDNFDFQTKDDFVRGLLMNEEILGSTVYAHFLKDNEYGGAVLNWRLYQALSLELAKRWIYPMIPSEKRNKLLPNDVIIAKTAKVSPTATLYRTVIGPNVTIGDHVHIQDSFIFENTQIEDDSTVTLSVVGPDCTIKKNSKVTAGCILGKGVVIDGGQFVENSLVQSSKPTNGTDEDTIGQNAYRLRISESEPDLYLDKQLAKQFSRLHIHELAYESETDDSAFSESEEELSHINSPAPDDTKLFFNEVIDSLTRGFEDKLLCDNLILEINSSRYAYNVTVNEVNFNVFKAILIMSQKIQQGAQYFSEFNKMLTYFTPLLKNYIRNESAMIDSLQAVEDVATSFDNISDKWTIFVVKYLYEKDYITEDSILDWFSTVNKSSNFHKQIKPFTDWLQEAEEEDSSEEE